MQSLEIVYGNIFSKQAIFVKAVFLYNVKLQHGEEPYGIFS